MVDPCGRTAWPRSAPSVAGGEQLGEVVQTCADDARAPSPLRRTTVVSAIRITFDSTKFGLKDLIIFLPGRLWGSSLSGGHVFAVAATDPRIAAVIAQAAMLSLVNANAPRRMAWGVMMPPKCSIRGSAREVPQAMDASGALGLTGLVRIPRAGGVHAFP